MSNTNYDVELPIQYSNTYRHYIPTYAISVPYYEKDYTTIWGDPQTKGYYEAHISFDDESETSLNYLWVKMNASPTPPETVWSDDYPTVFEYGNKNKPVVIPNSGVYSKIYFRNPRRSVVTFTASNCKVAVRYGTKAAFEIQWNSEGFAANTNPWFKCSTVQKNTYGQYEWTSATVYYKKTTESTYQSASGSITGTWSDYTINTNISLADGYTYDIYITAMSDDGQTASTPVSQFTTTDADAVATCISPSGAFTSGDVTFIWSHSTAYGTPQYAYDLEYSYDNGASWITLKSHEITSNTSASATLNNAGVVLWRVRTYNSNDVVGAWASATFVNNVPAMPPTNLVVNTKGRPTVEWTSTSQSAYQVQILSNESVVYDSGAVYSTEMSHFVNQYFDDMRAYTVRVRVYNALGEISGWTSTGYQQPIIADVEFEVTHANDGGAIITIEESEDFVKYYILRNSKPIALIEGTEYIDKYAAGLTNYGVVGVTSDEQSDIQTKGFRVSYPCATIIDQSGQSYAINKRVGDAYEIQTSNQADLNKANFIGDSLPTHYPSEMRLKSFRASCFDDQGIAEGLLGTMVFYADNFGNGGWCVVTAYEKTDNFIKNGAGVYANEVVLTLEVTNYDDSIEYSL